MVRERRRYFRIRSSQRTPAVFRVPHGTLCGELVDHSACGFGATFRGCVAIQVGQMGQLVTLGSRYQVKVTRVEQEGEITRIGFERLADLVVPPDEEISRIRWGWRRLCASRAVVRSLVWSGIAVAGLLAASIWAAASLICSSPFTLPEIRQQHARSRARPSFYRPASSERSTQPAIVSWLPIADSRAGTIANSESVTQLIELFEKKLAVSAEHAKLITAKTRILEFLSLPDVARLLQLSPEQQKEIAIVLEELRQQVESGIPAEKDASQWYLDAVQKAHDSVWEVLEPTQRELLMKTIHRASQPSATRP